jgi:arginase
VSNVIVLPFHRDEQLSELSIRLPAGTESLAVDPALPAADQWTRLAVLYDALATHVANSVQSGLVTRVVTGDCLATLGTLVGLQRSGLDPALVWFDAHGDVHTVESSTSGYLGGMALRMAIGEDSALLGGPLGLRALPESRAVLVGARDLDPAEATYLSRSNVRQMRVEDVSARDIPSGPVLVHVDLDVIDADEIPGLRFPAHSGPSAAQLFSALEPLLASSQVVALDIACPWFDPAGDAEAVHRTELLGTLVSLPA